MEFEDVKIQRIWTQQTKHPKQPQLRLHLQRLWTKSENASNLLIAVDSTGESISKHFYLVLPFAIFNAFLVRHMSEGYGIVQRHPRGWQQPI